MTMLRLIFQRYIPIFGKTGLDLRNNNYQKKINLHGQVVLHRCNLPFIVNDYQRTMNYS